MRAAWITLLLPACVIGAPPGFSPGESWTFPLVDPLAHEPLITPVVVDGKGPFLFVIDPDDFTSIDAGFIPSIPTVGNGPSYAPLVDVQIGTLHVASLPFIASKQHFRDVGDRRIAGVIGKEVITSGLVFGFDRDRGTAWLATPKHASIPSGARSFDYWERSAGRQAPKDRGPYVTGTIDGREQDFFIDLGHAANTIRPPRTTPAKQVTIDGIDRFSVVFLPFVDPKFLERERSATLGLDFFRELAIAVSYDAHRIYVAPRTAVAASARIARWSLACKHTGCAQLALHGKDLEVIPERAPMQVIVRAIARDGTVLPALEVNLDAGAHHFAVALDDSYADAALDVIDASPFPRTCLDAKECVVPY